jgi:hypothetical protein
VCLENGWDATAQVRRGEGGGRGFRGIVCLENGWDATAQVRRGGGVQGGTAGTDRERMKVESPRGYRYLRTLLFHPTYMQGVAVSSFSVDTYLE